MQKINLNEGWNFSDKPPMLLMMLMNGGKLTGETVNLPHDFMIGSDVYPEAPSGPASGFYSAGNGYYSKMLDIPAEWEGERVWLHFDGVMMNTTVEVNGSKVTLHHYGYTPFAADITDFVNYGEANRVVISVNASMQPNSRWYSGAGLFRGAELWHGPKLHLCADGIFGYTTKIEDGTAYLALQAEIANESCKTRLVEVTFSLNDEDGTTVRTQRTKIQVNANSTSVAYTTMTVDNARLWSAEDPQLYVLSASIKDTDVMKTRPIPVEKSMEDADGVLFGIRTIDWDVRHGLRVNGETVKLAGGCLHHDNGLLGAVTVYDAEARKVRRLKENGFNAVRTTHNPPSSAFIEACDRLGMYIFDEAFDAWGMGKQPGDYNMFFETDWKDDLTVFVKRDRSHPSVLIWSTGNEITERAGLGGGYEWQRKLADAVHALDPSRPVSNGICSFWNGLDDYTMTDMLNRAHASQMGQNADFTGRGDMLWEERTEAYTNGLDIVGYNYLENKYEQDHEMFPERVILGSENYPREIGQHWQMILDTPYVIGDFTWTAWDYLGEAGIGRAAFFDADDPILEKGPYALSSHGSPFPWRAANDADFDVCGNRLPQGVYRSIVFGSDATGLFSYDPAHFAKVELISQWGFVGVEDSWTWRGKEGQAVKVVAFSRAEEVELFLNGESQGRVKAGERLADNMPMSFVFETVYRPGELVAVSFVDGKEVSRAALVTAGEPASIELIPETAELAADSRSLCYVDVVVKDAEGRRVPDAALHLTAEAEGAAELLAFGSGNPMTDENYTAGTFTTYRGRALAVLRGGFAAGEAKLRVTADGMEAEVSVKVGQ